MSEKQAWWWVKSGDGGYTWGPFDTERDARIAQKSLEFHCDWMSWELVTDE